MKSTEHKALHYAVFPLASNVMPLKLNYLPQHPILKHP